MRDWHAEQDYTTMWVVKNSTDMVIVTRTTEDIARLIAAAPDLLEAIMAATSVRRDPRHRVSMLVNDWERILDAVEKATKP